jgi:uncharacterized protein (TIGR00106 family)
MNAIADICVIPINGEISLRKDVAKAHQILKETGLSLQLHGYGTNIEGDLTTILNAIKEIHEQLHSDGVSRLSTQIKLGTRIDKKTSIANKISAIDQEIKGIE